MTAPEWVEIVDRARAGDVDAQGSLLARFTPLVRSTAARLVIADDIDDVTQESFAVAIERLAGLRTSEAFPAWLRLIVRKQAQRHRSRAMRADRLETEEPADAMLDPADIVVRGDVADAVHLALTTVSDPDRRLLQLRYLAGWTNAEIADHLAISPGAVRKRLHDARRRLRPRLERLNAWEIQMNELDLFLDAIHDWDVTVPDAPPLAPPPDERTVTGLKVIDAIAPVRRGGTVEMTGPEGTGQVVLALELLYRLGRTPHELACVAVGLAGAAIGSQPDLGHVVTEPGIPAASTAVLYREPQRAPQAVEAGGRLAAGLAHGGRDVVLMVDGPTVDAVGADVLSRHAGLAREGAVTLVVVRPVARGDGPPRPLGLDTTLVFSMEQFARGVFPAVDPVRSTSAFAASHSATRVRSLIRRADEVLAWLHQDLFVASDFTGRAGTWVEPAEADRQLRAMEVAGSATDP